jgi:hypothetical protein
MFLRHSKANQQVHMAFLSDEDTNLTVTLLISVASSMSGYSHCVILLIYL